MSQKEESSGKFWAAVFLPFALVVYLLSMVAGQALVQRALLPEWLERVVNFAYAPLGWLIELID